MMNFYDGGAGAAAGVLTETDYNLLRCF